MSVPKP